MSHALAPDSVLALPGSAAAAVVWRAQGTLHVTVVVKATFDFVLDAPMRQTEPQPILWAEVHHNNSPARSIRFSTDLAPALTQADVLFTGSAYAPHGAPVRSLPVRLALFAGGRPILDKRLLVQDPEGLTRMPLVYERTGRGPDAAENPFGLASTDGVASIVDPARPGHPAGFGPIGRAWPTRRRLLGDVPRRVLDGPIAEIPHGFVWSYFQAAPLDQQTEGLHGDEWILLEGLHPSQPIFRTRLPAARGAAQIHGLGVLGVPEGHALELHPDTLRIEGDEQRCTVVWRGRFPIAGEDALPAVRVVAGVAVGGEALPWVEPVRAGAQAGSRVQAAVPHRTEPQTVALSPEADEEASRRLALPFGEARGPTAEPPATLVLVPDPAIARAPALPFQAGARPSLAAQTEAHKIFAAAPTGTLALSPDGIAPGADMPPFLQPRAPEPAPPPVNDALLESPPQPPEPPLPPAPARAIPAPAPETAEAGPWAPAPPPPAPPAPKPPAPAPTPPGASTTWKKGLYGRFSVRR